MAKKQTTVSKSELLEAAIVPVAEQPYKIPANWVWTYLLSGASQCLDSYRKPVNASERSTREGDIPYYGATGQVGWIDDYLTDEQLVLLGEDGAPFLDPIKNKAYIIEGKAWVNNHAHILRSFFGRTGNVYLMHYLNSFDYAGFVNGTTRLKLTQGSMAFMPVPLPPLAEQQRIVDRIESLFAKLDEAKEKAQEVVDGYDARRAAILHKAFSGELTAEWRSISNIPTSSWKRYKYGELGTSKLGKMLDQEKNTGRSIPYLRNVNVRWFTFDLQDVSTMLASETEIENLSVKNGDLFICEGGEPGRCAVWREQDAEMIFQKALHRFRPNEKVISEFLCYYLFYLSLNQSLNKFFTGTTIKHLTRKALAEIEVIVPSVDEQAQIVNRLQHLFDMEQMAKRAAEQAIIRIDNLKKSILARAFRGELETNDPTDESAVELLKDILGRNKTNKEEAKPVKKKVSVPAETDAKLDTAMERDIVKLFYKADTTDIPIRQIMSISSKKFELMDALRALEKKAILKKNDTGSYSLVKQE